MSDLIGHFTLPVAAAVLALQVATTKPPATPPPADPASSQFTTDAGLLLVTIKATAIADYEQAIRTLQQFDGIVEHASEGELSDAAARAHRTGFFCDPHTGVALAALEKLAARGDVGRADRVVVISTASGLKFTEFKTTYHAQDSKDARDAKEPRVFRPGEEARGARSEDRALLRNSPVELAADYDAVRRAIDGDV